MRSQLSHSFGEGPPWGGGFRVRVRNEKCQCFQRVYNVNLHPFFKLKVQPYIYKKGDEKNDSSTKPEETGFQQDSSSYL